MGELGSQWNHLIAEALRILNAGFVSVGLDFPILSSWALTIIFFTLLIKIVTLPLNLKQLRSTRATARLQPQLQALQKQYGKDREGLLKAQQELYKTAGVNPLSGCLPMLVQMPIWIGLYSALLFLASQPEFSNNSRFFWIHNLANTELTDITGVAHASLDVIFRWPPAIPILALLTGVTGWFQQKMMTMPSADPTQKQMQSMMQFMPIMFVFFSISVPAGLVLYWVSNNVFTMAQQWGLERWGGLDNHPAVEIPQTPPASVDRPAASAKNRAPAAALRSDTPSRADGAPTEPVRNALPQAAPGAKKRRRRSR